MVPVVSVGANWLVVQDPRGDRQLTVAIQGTQTKCNTNDSCARSTYTHSRTEIGVVGFYYLPPQAINLQVTVQDSVEELRYQFDVRIPASGSSVPSYGEFIERRTIMTPAVMLDSPVDFLFSCDKLTYAFFKNIVHYGMFVLPDGDMCAIPNPAMRFCLKLDGWKKGKKVRRYASQFRLQVTQNIRQRMMDVARYHEAAHGVTWIDSALITCFERLAEDVDNRGVKVYVVELREKSTDDVAAVIVALASGTIFHDVSMATLIRDGRSAGHLLSKALGHLLELSGYSHWYWGFKNPYMDDYRGYNPMHLSRPDFWELWHRNETVELNTDVDNAWI